MWTDYVKPAFSHVGVPWPAARGGRQDAIPQWRPARNLRFQSAQKRGMHGFYTRNRNRGLGNIPCIWVLESLGKERVMGPLQSTSLVPNLGPGKVLVLMQGCSEQGGAKLWPGGRSGSTSLYMKLDRGGSWLFQEPSLAELKLWIQQSSSTIPLLAFPRRPLDSAFQGA